MTITNLSNLGIPSLCMICREYELNVTFGISSLVVLSLICAILLFFSKKEKL